MDLTVELPHCDWTIRPKEHGVYGDITYYKNGNPKVFYKYPTTWLRVCDCCGKLSTPKRVQAACFFIPGFVSSYGYDAHLCTSCRNKFRALDHRYNKAEELRLQSGRLNRLRQKIQREEKREQMDIRAAQGAQPAHEERMGTEGNGSSASAGGRG